MSLFRGIDISGSALSAERLRMDVISENLANVNTTRTSEGGPYKRKDVVFGSSSSSTFQQHLDSMLKSSGASRFVSSEARQGVKAIAVVKDDSDPILRYEPDHPDADDLGYVAYPNVDPLREMVDLMTASRSYEANVTALNTSKAMFMKALEIGKG